MSNTYYSLEDIYNILDESELSFTLCSNEFHGHHDPYHDTIQVSKEDGDDYFGEFIVEKENEMGYFKFYIK